MFQRKTGPPSLLRAPAPRELARYYPDIWVNALDVDHSPAATTLEHGLDLALERAPVFISEALRGPIDELIREEIRRIEEEAKAKADAQKAKEQSNASQGTPPPNG